MRLRRAQSRKITTTLPTIVPGVAFKGDGRVWYRPIPPDDPQLPPEHPECPAHPNAAAARAAAFAAVDATARAITEKLHPEQAFEAEQKVTMALTSWETTPAYADIAFRSRLRITLPEHDRKRAEKFSEARRAARLEAVLAEDASTYLLEGHLADITHARLWWLKQYLNQPEPDLSWEAFDEHIRPLVSDAHRPENDIDRLARILLTTADRIKGDNALRTAVLQILEHTFASLKWPDLASDVSALNRPLNEEEYTPAAHP